MNSENKSIASATAHAEAGGKNIVTTRLFNAPRELIWEALTDPNHVAKWWGPVGFTNTIQEMDLRPGGNWRLVMHGPDGTDYKNHSVFTEVVAPERISFRHLSGPKFHSTWIFETENGMTRITMTLVFETTADRDRTIKEFGAAEGGKQTFERLAEYLEKAKL